MKTTKSILSGVAASFIPLLLPEVSVAFTENVAAGSLVSDERIASARGEGIQQVYGTATNMVIDAGGVQIINAGGVTNNSVVNSGGTLRNNGGTDNATTVKSGGTFLLAGQTTSYALSNNALIENAALVVIDNYVQTESWTINVGKLDYIYLQGASSVMKNTTVNTGRFWMETGETLNTTLNSGYFVNVNGSDINTTINGGTYFLGGTMQARSESLTINSYGYGNLNSGTITNATINGSLIVTPNNINPEVLSSLQGDITVNDEGRLIIVTGADTDKASYYASGSIYLSSNAAFSGEYYFALGDVTLTGGTVVYDPKGYSTLTLKTLSGNGTFLMDTKISALQGDFLTVTGRATGDFAVYVTDNGVSPTHSNSLQVIQIGDGDATFALANSGRVVDLGTYQYYLVADGQGGWSLTPQKAEAEEDPATDEETEQSSPTEDAQPDATTEDEVTPDNQADVLPEEQGGTPPEDEAKEDVAAEPSPSADYSITPAAAAVLSVATVDPLIFRQELETLSERLTNTDSPEHDHNVWGTAYNGRLNVSNRAGADYRLSLSSLTIGIDRAQQGMESAAWQGIFFSYGHSDMRFRGKGIGKADIDSWSGGFYGSWQHDAGDWLNGVLKLNHFMHEVRARMTSGGAADGNFSTNGVGVSVKAGHDFQAGAGKVTPWIGVIGFTGKSSDLTLSNGMVAHTGPQRSLIAAVGVRTEYEIQIRETLLYPWASVGLERETVTKNRVRINGETFNNELSGSRGVYQAGVRAALSSTLSLHASAGYMQGRHIESPWSATAGVNWQF
ncbi:autotransporter outer membrane beta-barrel domain-containing protein [Erwinia sp. 198]|uniref:autotransporter outer membrane beta-barrel domain-containing protein n=1 Tax=Erwinia sp. 198 TaxID=2022746 RepID=UPI000F680BDB|nr:autotransporter outer membrane beta-barrel domain-containing protein [Erwinia sp. 198]RRZ91564.1 autotransporter outer membrane beta-barrel domain-containing protein [Erwinia sp. 198]